MEHESAPPLLSIEQIWRQRVGLFGVLVFAGIAMLTLAAPPQTPAWLRLLIYIFSGCGIFFYVQFLRAQPWTRLFLILINLLAFLWSFWVLGNIVPELLVSDVGPTALANLLGSVGLNSWILIVEIQFLMLFEKNNWTRASGDVTEWMQSKIFITAIIVALALLLASLNHIDQARSHGFFRNIPGTLTMEVTMTRIALFGFWGWGAWHVGLCAISLLLLGSILSFLWLQRGAALIPASCLLLAGWMLLCGLLSLGTILTDPILRRLWYFALTFTLYTTGLGTLLCYWLYDAFRFAFHPDAYRAARARDEFAFV